MKEINECCVKKLKPNGLSETEHNIETITTMLDLHEQGEDKIDIFMNYPFIGICEDTDTFDFKFGSYCTADRSGPHIVLYKKDLTKELIERIHKFQKTK